MLVEISELLYIWKMTSIQVLRQFFAAISGLLNVYIQNYSFQKLIKKTKNKSIILVPVNFIGFSFGWSCSWANVNFLELQSPETSLEDGPISYDQASLLMSLICVGGLIGNLTYLWALETFGRKKPILFLSVPIIVRTFKITRVLYWSRHFIVFIVELCVHHICKKCKLVLCFTPTLRIRWRFNFHFDSSFRIWDLFRQVKYIYSQSYNLQ